MQSTVRRSLSWLMVLGFLVLAGPAGAVEITWVFSGVLEAGSGGEMTPFSGTLRYDSSVSPSSTTATSATHSFTDPAQFDLQVQLDGNTFATTGAVIDGSFQVFDDSPDACFPFPFSGCDGYLVLDRTSLRTDSTGSDVVTVGLALYDTTETAVPNLDLPTEVPDLSEFGSASFFLLDESDSPVFSAQVQLLAPEPSTGLLLGAGLVALGAARRRP